MRRALPLIPALLCAGPATAHGFTGSGLLHPLTGPDHMLAMIAVGVWSAQLGGRALWTVPSAFVVAMATGWAAATGGLPLPGTEVLIAVSVILLGLAVALARPMGWPLAALATLAFGLSHGYAHGGEMPAAASPMLYAGGFLVTTIGLHIFGLAGGALILQEAKGRAILRVLGAGASVAGLYFLTIG